MPRVTIDVSDEHVAWLDTVVAAEKRSKSEIVRDAISAFMASPVETKEPEHTSSFGREYGPQILSAVEHLAHRYMIDHPKEGETPDTRLIEFRKRYMQAAEEGNG